jgi:hypothetical protein
MSDIEIIECLIEFELEQSKKTSNIPSDSTNKQMRGVKRKLDIETKIEALVCGVKIIENELKSATATLDSIQTNSTIHSIVNNMKQLAFKFKDCVHVINGVVNDFDSLDDKLEL